jgi:hypothetical protein
MKPWRVTALFEGGGIFVSVLLLHGGEAWQTQVREVLAVFTAPLCFVRGHCGMSSRLWETIEDEEPKSELDVVISLRSVQVDVGQASYRAWERSTVILV